MYNRLVLQYELLQSEHMGLKQELDLMRDTRIDQSECDTEHGMVSESGITSGMMLTSADIRSILRFVRVNGLCLGTSRRGQSVDSQRRV